MPEEEKERFEQQRQAGKECQQPPPEGESPTFTSQDTPYEMGDATSVLRPEFIENELQGFVLRGSEAWRRAYGGVVDGPRREPSQGESQKLLCGAYAGVGLQNCRCRLGDDLVARVGVFRDMLAAVAEHDKGSDNVHVYRYASDGFEPIFVALGVGMFGIGLEQQVYLEMIFQDGRLQLPVDGFVGQLSEANRPLWTEGELSSRMARLSSEWEVQRVIYNPVKTGEELHLDILSLEDIPWRTVTMRNQGRSGLSQYDGLNEALDLERRICAAPRPKRPRAPASTQPKAKASSGKYMYKKPLAKKAKPGASSASVPPATETSETSSHSEGSDREYWDGEVAPDDLRDPLVMASWHAALEEVEKHAPTKKLIKGQDPAGLYHVFDYEGTNLGSISYLRPFTGTAAMSCYCKKCKAGVLVPIQ